MDTRFGQRLERGRRSLLNRIGNADGTRNLAIYAKKNCGRPVSAQGVSTLRQLGSRDPLFTKKAGISRNKPKSLDDAGYALADRLIDVTRFAACEPPASIGKG